jgi:FkbM family methyltransferase
MRANAIAVPAADRGILRRVTFQERARATMFEHTPLGDRATRKRLVHTRRRVFEALGSQRFSRPAAEAIDSKLERYLPERPGVFVEAGANDGYTWSNTYYLERWRGWSGVLVEGIPELAAECRRLRTRSQVFNCALVADAMATPAVTMTYADLGSLISHSEPELEARLDDIERERYEVEVPARTLGAVLTAAGIERPDFISLDLEGHEPAALRGMDVERQGADWMLIEVLGHEGRSGVEAALGDLYEPVAELSGADVLFRRRAG